MIKSATKSGTTSDNEWQQVVKPLAANDNKWQQEATNDSKLPCRLNLFFSKK